MEGRWAVAGGQSSARSYREEPTPPFFLSGEHMENEVNAPGNTSTECICPRCRIPHRKKLYWKGTLPARIYCTPCKNIADKTDMCSISIVARGRDIGYHIAKREM